MHVEVDDCKAVVAVAAGRKNVRPGVRMLVRQSHREWKCGLFEPFLAGAAADRGLP